MTQTMTFNPWTDDLFEGWEPTAQDYADLDAIVEAEFAELTWAWADYFESVFDPD